VVQPDPLDDFPIPSQPARFSFVTGGLREAVQLAGELREVLPTEVTVRPARLARMDPRSWVVFVLTPPLAASLVEALEAEMRRLASKAPGRAFLGRIHPAGSAVIRRARNPVTENSAAMRIVIIDDSIPFRQAARGLVEGRGHQVVGEAGGVAPGFGLVERLHPDLVLLDVQLPDGSGLDLCTLLSGQKLAPAVLLVSNGKLEDPSVVERCGASGFSLKGRLAYVDLDALTH
jgi:CheY-like chemotaxis protein